MEDSTHPLGRQIRGSFLVPGSRSLAFDTWDVVMPLESCSSGNPYYTSALGASVAGSTKSLVSNRSAWMAIVASAGDTLGSVHYLAAGRSVHVGEYQVLGLGCSRRTATGR